MRPNEPPFALCGPSGTLVADGVRTRFCEVPAAQAALRSGAASILLGALPFDVNTPAALMVPVTVRRTGALPDWPTGPLPEVRIAAAIPPLADYRARISRARGQLAEPGNSLHKVVLARALQLAADAPMDARVILRRLVAADPPGYGYLVDLTSAGDDYAGAALIGASPERWSRAPATASCASRLPVRPRALPTPNSTLPTAPRWPPQPRTVTSTNWSSTRCGPPWSHCVTT